MNVCDKAERGYGAPVLAVCGYSGSGKTTLLEKAIPQLVKRGLAVAVVKHDSHGFEVDKPGKDSDRLFRAGATVTLSGPQQQFERRDHERTLALQSTLARLALDHDLLLVEGHKDTPLPKLWMESADRLAAPGDVTNIVASLAWDGDRLTAFMSYIDEWLPAAWSGRPLYGGLFVGGMSSRMGSPKQLLRFGDRTLGEIADSALRAKGIRKAVALGAGLLPDTIQSIDRLPDPPHSAGPGAGLMAAHRWAPEAGWTVAACDHPWLRSDHIAWLAAQRKPGRWAVIPRQEDGHPCPTVALYEPQALEWLERRSRVSGEHVRLLDLLDSPHAAVIEPPRELADGWKNVNTPDELRAAEEHLARVQERG